MPGILKLAVSHPYTEFQCLALEVIFRPVFRSQSTRLPGRASLTLLYFERTPEN